MTATTTHPATRWWHPEGDKVVCTLCPRECHIPAGSRGFCFVRANVDGELVLTTYGRSSGFCIDPVEKKPLNHFLPGTPILSLGTAGCNLGCKFCQNWDISKSREMDTLASQATPEAIVAAAKQTGCKSIAFTYNDPVIWAEYAIDIARVARAEGIKTVAVTAGYISPEARTEFYQWMDAANVDLKAFTETFYRKLCQTQLEPVLDTLKYLKRETQVWFELTNLMIPGENDSPEETAAMCDWIVEHLGPDVPVHFTAFHPDFKMRDTPPTPPATLVRARKQALAAGIRFAYVGNVNDVEHQSTYCPGCGQMLIERDWYELGRYRLDGNLCAGCGATIPGVFEKGRGNWGRKRMPIRIAPPSPEFITIDTSAAKKAAAAMSTASMSPAAGSKIDFDEAQVEAILHFTRAAVHAAVTGDPIRAALAADVSKAPGYGLFVTLQRGETLRACRGCCGGEGSSTFGEMLASVARDTALDDGRFPRICEEELDLLSVDVSIMHSPAMLEADAEDDRVAAVEVGRHGLVLSHPRGRGLLLPHVATENHWDARTFLEHLSIKAGLPKDAWLDPQTQILTFQTRLLSDSAPVCELNPRELTVRQMSSLVHTANAVVAGETIEDDFDPVLTYPHDEELGLYLVTDSGLNATTIGAGHCLVDLVRLAANSFRQMLDKGKRTPEPITRMAILWQPIRLDARDYPQRHQLLVNHAVLARGRGNWSLALPKGPSRGDRVGEALSSAAITAATWLGNQRENSKMPRLTAFQVHGFDARHIPGIAGTRRPARAGQFYPDSAQAIAREIRHHLTQAAEASSSPHRAVMLPHAGWRFCGDTIARTLAHTHVPDTVIVIGPNHTGKGPLCSIAPHQYWELPGTIIPVATDIVESLIQRVPALQCEPEAHRMEHGCEVLLPFLHHVNPKLRVAPIVMGHCTYDQTQPLAAAMAKIIADTPALLVISSDMNHFAGDAENRRLDKLALEAMARGPRDLYDACTRHKISMCGMVPAVVVMRALLQTSHALTVRVIDYRTSAEASGDFSSVVGYAGVVID